MEMQPPSCSTSQPLQHQQRQTTRSSTPHLHHSITSQLYRHSATMPSTTTKVSRTIVVVLLGAHLRPNHQCWSTLLVSSQCVQQDPESMSEFKVNTLEYKAGHMKFTMLEFRLSFRVFLQPSISLISLSFWLTKADKRTMFVQQRHIQLTRID